MLSELKGGEMLVSKRGLSYRVRKVPNLGKHASQWDAPLYRLERVVVGEQTVDD